MKRVGITQRVDYLAEYSEYRDCLDQRWSDILFSLGVLCVPLPNLKPALASELLESLELDAVIFSGGNTLTSAEPNASDASNRRDQFESAALGVCIEKSIPILGVCRGMQFLNVALGGSIEKIKDHVATRHSIFQERNQKKFLREVNSYHSWSVPLGALAPELNSLAFDACGNVEAYEHMTLRLRGMMWHPEREVRTQSSDLEFIGALLT